MITFTFIFYYNNIIYSNILSLSAFYFIISVYSVSHKELNIKTKYSSPQPPTIQNKNNWKQSIYPNKR